MSQSFISIILVAFQAYSILLARNVDRPFLIMFLVSSVYYSVMAPFYWMASGAYFSGINWSDELWNAALILNVSGVYVSCLIAIIGNLRRPTKFFESNYNLPRCFYLFVVIGLICAFYVVLNGFNSTSKDPLLLIAYQCSDLLIPCLIFWISYSSFNRYNVIAVLLFICYAAAVGFRYKIILVGFPLLYLFYKVRPDLKGRLMLIFSSISLMSLFSLMTIARRKFEGLDFSSVSGASQEDLWYGFFAESNIIFGLISIITGVVNQADYIYFKPIQDLVLELTPRFLYPEKNTGEYLLRSLRGLITDEGLNSATAYPFIGEYLMMYGYVGLGIGCTLFAFLYIKLREITVTRAPSRNLLFSGLALSAVYFGYFYYSRGFLPAIFKGGLITVAPFLIMLRASRLHKKYPRKVLLSKLY